MNPDPWRHYEKGGLVYEIKDTVYVVTATNIGSTVMSIIEVHMDQQKAEALAIALRQAGDGSYEYDVVPKKVVS